MQEKWLIIVLWAIEVQFLLGLTHRSNALSNSYLDKEKVKQPFRCVKGLQKSDVAILWQKKTSFRQIESAIFQQKNSFQVPIIFFILWNKKYKYLLKCSQYILNYMQIIFC